MDNLMQLISQIPDTVQLIAAVLGAVAAIFGAVRGFVEIRDWWQDFLDRIKGARPFRVRTTILKAIIREQETEIVKLRTIRFHKELQKIEELDRVPLIEGSDHKERYAKFNNHYSVPGIAFISADNKWLEIDLRQEERFPKGKDHSIVLGYTMQGTLKELFEPSGLVAEPPVGSERLSIEAYFPPKWRLRHDENNRRLIRVYARDVNTKKETNLPESKEVKIIDGRRDFNDGNGLIDWIRVVVTDPPQGSSINVDWEWEKEPIQTKAIDVDPHLDRADASAQVVKTS